MIFIILASLRSKPVGKRLSYYLDFSHLRSSMLRLDVALADNHVRKYFIYIYLCDHKFASFCFSSTLYLAPESACYLSKQSNKLQHKPPVSAHFVIRCPVFFDLHIMLLSTLMCFSMRFTLHSFKAVLCILVCFRLRHYNRPSNEHFYN